MSAIDQVLAKQRTITHADSKRLTLGLAIKLLEEVKPSVVSLADQVKYEEILRKVELFRISASGSFYAEKFILEEISDFKHSLLTDDPLH